MIWRASFKFREIEDVFYGTEEECLAFLDRLRSEKPAGLSLGPEPSSEEAMNEELGQGFMLLREQDPR